jgi:acyl-coenzyme A synthetase/AMP-(fatty) acid ligase/acyl carrier protein
MASMIVMDQRGRDAVRSLQNFMVGGEAFPVPLARQLQDLVAGAVINMYGPTETTIWSSTFRLDGPIGSSISIGTPIANTQLYIVNADCLPQPVGVPGELLIGGDGVARGYLNRPELTAERFIPDPFSTTPGARLYRTGDLARWLPDGNVEFLGRLDNQVKVRGHRIELGEIETLLNDHAAVREAVVIAREDLPGDKRLVGYVVPDNGAVSVAALRDLLAEHLPDFMVPSAIVVMSSFPHTPNNKIDRKALPAPDLGAEASSAPPEGELESSIAAVWQGVLGVDRIGRDDDFFALGGHSLSAVQLTARLSERLAVDVPLRTLFEAPTVARLAVAVEAIAGANGSGHRAKAPAERV